MSERFPRATDTDGLLLGDQGPGARIGEYLVERRLPTRGTGHVYEAVHVVLPRRVTIKVMPAAQPWGKAIAIALLREACIVEALDHPGIPRVYELGMLADRRPWIASELVGGATLATIVERGALSTLEAAAIVRDVATILAHAHGRGLVHGNVCPTAIVVPDTARRFPLVLVDWAGARPHDSTTPAPMRSTPVRSFTAPEVRLGEPLDRRADVYALGMVARELLRRACPGTAPPVFTALVRRMVDIDPDERPAASSVADHAGWLADQIDPEVAIPEPIEDPTERRSILITSELSSDVSGEIRTD